MRYALFWGITQRRVAILYRRFGTTYRSHLQGSKKRKNLFSSWTYVPDQSNLRLTTVLFKIDVSVILVCVRVLFKCSRVFSIFNQFPLCISRLSPIRAVTRHVHMLRSIHLRWNCTIFISYTISYGFEHQPNIRKFISICNGFRLILPHVNL
jgi:hypothetical protein